MVKDLFQLRKTRSDTHDMLECQRCKREFTRSSSRLLSCSVDLTPAQKDDATFGEVEGQEELRKNCAFRSTLRLPSMLTLMKQPALTCVQQKALPNY